MKGGLMSFLINGFGTGVTALRAVGIVLAISLFGFWLAWKIIMIIYRAIKGPEIPDFREGSYAVQITSVGDNPAAVQKELAQIKGYSKSLAKKVTAQVPSLAVVGCDEEMAEDFKVIIEHGGATCDILVRK